MLQGHFTQLITTKTRCQCHDMKILLSYLNSDLILNIFWKNVILSSYARTLQYSWNSL